MMFAAYWMATADAAADPHSVLGHSRSGHGWQFGDVGEIHPLFPQLTSAAGARVQDHRYSYGGLGDLFGAGRLPEGEGALTRLAARAHRAADPGALGKGSCLALFLSGEPVHLATEVLDASLKLDQLTL